MKHFSASKLSSALLGLSLLVSQVAFAAAANTGKVAQADSDSMAEAIFKGNSKQVQALKKKGVSLDAVSSSNTTGLMQLAEEGRLAEIKKIVAQGAKVDKTNADGETALFSATYSGHDDIALFLLSKGAKADHVNKSTKECVIHAAAKAQLTDLSKKLAAAAPKCLKQKNVDGKTPADLAIELGNPELAKILKP
ncbi:MAG: ankyrin repeat domain-containing protein [Proteobacteria bacterium]|nr:MAG: ankyrin repeat domain-containing protein [Pseudomonadota bacterium]